ncbi:hypothetical protein A3C21_02355 [Candidatus Kaiserbacteria bacterium RIFCSPHIGHO2_02_FULL_59_21]|uniref:Uncharacterized protein n=1 Tax=Candidatus Kaiserbacteria bacterium RIFCSPHIGHO2_02_FULL_59_21 TaxID=1798500 RepID=A0A1F6E092_9BACT|nr:MAG: hypothetical protein A2766_04165 [Candidatus Kaiserbacteria bacterium RIFCSPHIGHO2_01_FULL_58_22]OGG67078.1 MAG: hypothetical protein A3C21_02355 [Candidatus Kaiserbacteria bacterium RIFCSPHIGHO2_02_FULL_59_21]OGG79465.1 MAG: hypothetical protein A2952_00170 [Candidatus Kaiserbacteria bacterium RIFCSPLOWO2_01_FULL_59_34]OGG86843.1 MAG: hypothetical protein A3I47_04220 [Candidatus Kaiserbacteria bacterium RIFCSPLOWO2_02_FULL_59_19]
MDIVKNKGLWIALGIIIIVALIFFAAQGGQGIGGDAGSAAQGETESTEDVSAGSANAGLGAAPLSYQQALAKYADHRIQFDATCQANPSTITYKDNTGLMLDNRSPVARTIKLLNAHTVKAWGFKIVTLPDTYRASKTILVDCDGSQNVATILVQE